MYMNTGWPARAASMAVVWHLSGVGRQPQCKAKVGDTAHTARLAEVAAKVAAKAAKGDVRRKLRKV